MNEGLVHKLVMLHVSKPVFTNTPMPIKLLLHFVCYYIVYDINICYVHYYRFQDMLL